MGIVCCKGARGTAGKVKRKKKVLLFFHIDVKLFSVNYAIKFSFDIFHPEIQSPAAYFPPWYKIM